MTENNRKKINPTDKAFLEWKKEDFINANEEIPNSLIFDDFHTEGELMNDEEIADWILDTKKTFSVLKENNPELFEELYTEYIKDLKYLLKLKRIDENTYDELLDKKNFDF